MEDNKAIFKRLLSSIRSGNPAVLYTLVDTEGYTDIKTGSRLLICSGGRKYGTLGKESLDLEMQARGEKILSSSVPGTGLIESTVKILEESYFPRKKLLVFGGGHVSLPLVEMAGILGYYTVVADDRPEFANRERFPGAGKIMCSDFDDIFQKVIPEIDSFTSVVIVTRGHDYDKSCLEHVINSRARYIGMIGSLGKVRRIFKILLSKGVSKKDIERVSAPIGLDLGGQKPEEIALSILAEMVALENNGTGRPLKEIKAGLLE